MKNEFSEFSYGFALTEDFIRQLPHPLTAAPVFPSLIEEGNLGWDVRLNSPGIPIMLQFKTSDYLRQRSAKYYPEFGRPYYRFKIWQNARSRQHRNLLQIDNGQNEVYYVAPGFHRTTELNDVYASQTVSMRSIFVRPSSVGTLDDEQHYVAFTRSSSGGWDVYYCSEPIPIRDRCDWGSVSKHLYSILYANNSPTLHEQLQRLYNEMRTIVGKDEPSESYTGDDNQVKVAPFVLLERIARFSAIHFHCELIVVGIQQ